MPLLLPLAAFLVFYQILRLHGFVPRVAILVAAIFLGTCVTAITELLSAGSLLVPAGVSFAWVLVTASSVGYLFSSKKSPDAQLRHINQGNVDEKVQWEFAEGIWIAAIATIACLVGVTAILAPPATWDAMLYHLPRITMWMSNHSVRFFPTPDYLQLIMAPWAEYAMMQTILLSGGDRFVNVIEFLSYCGSIVGVSLIAKQLGAGRRGQVIGALVCASIPEGVLEASGPMNTYVVSFWITTTVAMILLWNERRSWLYAICIGLSAGLAVQTKGTAYIYLPFLAAAGWWIGSKEAKWLLIRRIPVLMVLALALNAPQYIRNFELTGSPLGLPLPEKFPRVEVTIKDVDARGTAANVIRNLAVHTVTPFNAINAVTERASRSAITALGKDPDDPHAIWGDAKFQMHRFNLDEIFAGNPLHLALIFISIVIVITDLGRKGPRPPIWYGLAIVAGFVAVSAVLLWNPFESRYHLALFVVGSALVGLTIERRFSWRLAALVGAACFVCGLGFACFNQMRALIPLGAMAPWGHVVSIYQPRQLGYFADKHEEVAESYIAAAKAINQLSCKMVAIDSYVPDPAIYHAPASLWVYPLFAMINGDGQRRTMWYTGVINKTTRYSAVNAQRVPCAVVCLDCANNPEKWKEYSGLNAQPAAFSNIVVFHTEEAMRKGELAQ
jgi:hypothetical protein